MNDKINAAAAVLEAMGGETVVDAPSNAKHEMETPPDEKATEKAIKALTKVKKPVAPTRPGPTTLAVDFPANTVHAATGGGQFEVVKVRVSYLVRILPNGRLTWFSARKTKALAASQAAGAEHAETAATV